MPANVRRFGATSCDLHAIADWLKECGVTTVAMESTGVYWIPLFELLQLRGFEVWLVEPGQLSRCGARDLEERIISLEARLVETGQQGANQQGNQYGTNQQTFPLAAA